MWASNAPWGFSGYSNQTRLITRRLLAAGHAVGISAWYGLEGGVIGWEGMPVFPKWQRPYGDDIMSAHAAYFEADILVSLIDAWVLEPGLFQAGTRWVPLFPIDAEPLAPAILDKVRQAWQPIVYSQFGQRVAAEAGIEARYAPHGVETAVFAPMDRAEARQSLRLPEDRFIIGMVAANKDQSDRKAFSAQFRAFAQFRAKHPDALLYVHTIPAISYGLDLRQLAAVIGIDQHVIFPPEYPLIVGMDDDHMRRTYAAFDVLSSVSMGEGFGIPIVEAQSCGTPVIVGGWSSMPELCFGGWTVAKADADPYWPRAYGGSWMYAPRAAAIAEAYEEAYKADRDALGVRARAGALAYDIDRVMAEYWTPVLADMERRIEVSRQVMARMQAKQAVPA